MFIVRWIRKILRSKKLWAFIVVVCLAAIGYLHIKNSLNQPSVGTVNLQSSQTMSINKTPTLPITIKGAYLSLTYPARYRTVGVSNRGSLLQVVDLYSTDKTEISVAIAVSRESVSQDSGIYLRQHEPQIYTSIPASVAQTINFESTNNGQNGYERDEFIIHNNLVASIIITGPSKQAIGQDFTSIVNSIVWQ